jgi:hypothetical protein
MSRISFSEMKLQPLGDAEIQPIFHEGTAAK